MSKKSDVPGESPSRASRRAELNRLYDKLTLHAKRVIGPSQHDADLQPESVVQSVLVHELDRGAIDACKDERHLEARLKLAIKNKILDRKKKMRPGALPSRGDDGGSLDPRDAGAGPATMVMRIEEASRDGDKLTAFREACLAPLAGSDRSLLDRHLFQEQSWEQVAREIGTTAGAAKKKMSAHIRPKVLTHLLNPLRSSLNGGAWKIVELHFIQRLPLARAAEMIGLSAARAEQILNDRIQQELLERFGEAGVPIFCKLLGRTR